MSVIFCVYSTQKHCLGKDARPFFFVKALKPLLFRFAGWLPRFVVVSPHPVPADRDAAILGGFWLWGFARPARLRAAFS